MALNFDCDPKKRASVASERRFDLLQMRQVFEDDLRLDFEDARFDYGEERRVTIGRAFGKVFTVVYTIRGSVIWLITAWPAHRKERARYARR